MNKFKNIAGLPDLLFPGSIHPFGNFINGRTKIYDGGGRLYFHQPVFIEPMFLEITEHSIVAIRILQNKGR